MAAASPQRLTLLHGRFVALVVSALSTACLSDSPTAPRQPPEAVASISVTAVRTTLAPGDTLRLTAQVMDGSGRVLAEPVTWSSSTVKVATVDPGGLVTADSVGATTIIASAGGKRGTVDILVMNTVLCDCTIVIDSTRVTLISRNDTTGVYLFQVIRGPAPDIKVGSILVGAEDGGYLRRVEQVTVTGSQIQVETSIAYLEEAISDGGFNTTSFSEEESGSLQPGGTWWGPWTTTYLAPGVSPGPQGLSLNNLTILIKIAPDTNIPVAGTLTFTIKDGDIIFAPRIDIGARIRWFSLREVHTIFRGDLGLNLNTYEVKLAVAVTKGVAPLKKESVTFITQQRPYVTFIGPLPLVALITKKIKLEITPVVSASAVFTGTFKAGFGVAAGAQWLRGSGWRGISEATSYFDATAPTFTGAEGTVSLKIAVVPEFSVLFYGVAGPYVNLEPYALAAASTVMSFADGARTGWDWETRVDLGLNLNVGARLSLFGRKDLFGFNVAIPVIQPWRFIQAWSDGPLMVRTRSTGEDVPGTFGIRLRPAWDPVTGPRDAYLGRNHGTSTQDVVIPANDSVTLTDIRSGRGARHQLRLTDVAGNCALTNPNPDTVTIGSSLFLATGGARTDTTFQVDCIPLGDLGLSVTGSGPHVPARYLASLRRLDTVGVGKADSALTVNVPADTVLEDFIPANRLNGANGLLSVTLNPPRRNCAIVRPANHAVGILSGDTVDTRFGVTCVPHGLIRILSATTDPDPDPGASAGSLGYLPAVIPTAEIDSVLVPPGSLGDNDSSLVSDLVPLYNASGAPGSYSVALNGAPNRCREPGRYQRSVTVFPGDTAIADFSVQCVERLHVRTTTTGPGTDVDGYLVIVGYADGTADTSAIGINQTSGIGGIRAGDHLIRLADVEPSCVAPIDVIHTVSGRDSTLVNFVVTCPAPPPPAGVHATLVEANRIDLAWTAPTGVPIAKFRIYRNGILHDSTTTTAFSDGGLTSFTAFTYRVATVNQAGLEGAGSAPLTVRTLDATAPTAPGNLTAVPASASRITLSWAASSDPESGIARYQVYRDGSLIGSATALAFADSNLTPGTTYSYVVTAVNPSGLEGPPSNTASATTLDGSPPGAPGGVVATPASSNRIDLSWSPASDPESGIQGYLVYRNGVRVGSPVATTFSDTGLLPNTSYTYTITAVNGAGLEGPASVPVTVTTPVPPLVDLVVQNTTTGRPPATYTVLVEQGSTSFSQVIAANGSVTFPTLAAGDYVVTLQSVPTRCSATPPNPRVITLPAGSGSVTTTFAVTCPK